MTARNDVTGDAIKTKSSSDAYRDGWDLAFGEKNEMSNEEFQEACDEAFDQIIGTDLPYQQDFDFIVGGHMFGKTLEDAVAEAVDMREVYDQWKIDAENTKRLNDLTQED